LPITLQIKLSFWHIPAGFSRRLPPQPAVGANCMEKAALQKIPFLPNSLKTHNMTHG